MFYQNNPLDKLSRRSDHDDTSFNGAHLMFGLFKRNLGSAM